MNKSADLASTIWTALAGLVLVVTTLVAVIFWRYGDWVYTDGLEKLTLLGMFLAGAVLLVGGGGAALWLCLLGLDQIHRRIGGRWTVFPDLHLLDLQAGSCAVHRLLLQTPEKILDQDLGPRVPCAVNLVDRAKSLHREIDPRDLLRIAEMDSLDHRNRQPFAK